MKTYLRFLGKRRVGGIIIAFTGPGERDAYGNYWSNATDLTLQRYDKRPLYFQHRGNVDEAGIIERGDLEVTERGLYMEVDLLETDAGDACLRYVMEGRGHYSTGVMPGSWREAGDGHVELWPWVEASVTDHPATRHGLTKGDLVARSIGLEGVAEGDKFLRRGPIMPEKDKQGNGAAPAAAEVKGPVITLGRDDLVSFVREDLGPVIREVVADIMPAARVVEPAPLPPALLPDRVEPVQVRHAFDDLTLGALALRLKMLHDMGKLRSGQMTTGIRALQAKIEKQRVIDDAITDRDLMRGAVRMLDAEFYGNWGTHIRADEGMKSDYANYGDELVPTLLNPAIWYHFMLEARVLNALPRFQMPSNPYDYPIVTSGPTIRKVAEVADQANYSVHASVYPASKIGTDKITFAAGKIGALVLGSQELFEDAGMSIQNVWFTQMVRKMASAIDEVLISGDESATATNISHYGTDPTGTTYDKILILDGLRHIATGNSDTAAQTTIAVDSPLALRALMGSRGVFGLYPRDLVIICDPAVYYDILALDTFESLSDMGPQATLLTGMVGAIKGVPIIVSDELEATNASGQIEDSHDSALASYLVARTPGLLVGFMRQVTSEFFKVPGTDGFAADISVRLDMQEMEAGQVAMGYNVGGE